MTTFRKVEVVCSNCGNESGHEALGSTNQFGSPDLDLRPPEMARSTMYFWLQECPECGWVAPRLSDEWVDENGLLTSAEYQQARIDESLPPLARRFKRRAMIAEASGDAQDAFDQWLRAAWVMDDQGLTEPARAFRQGAMRCLENLAGLEPEQKLQLLDVMRRCGAWERAGALAEELAASQISGTLKAVVELQLRLIEQRDEARHVVSEAMPATAEAPRPPAQPEKRPQERRKRRWFWF